MLIRSLGRQTDLIFARFSGSVEDNDNYTLVKTPSNPGYHWGNYIIFDSAPQNGDLKQWKKVFDSEFEYYREPHHYTFTWDTEKEEKGDYQEFIENSFEFESGVVLTSQKIHLPPRPNSQIKVRPLSLDTEWEEAIQLQNLCADPKYLNDYYIDFKIAQMRQYREMSDAGKGYWFGAFLNGKMVGNLGIFFENKIGRYQSVGTDPRKRNQGICGTLVYESGKMMMDSFGLNTLVMEADPEYHAARIYESVGFNRNETNYSLSWWRGMTTN